MAQAFWRYLLPLAPFVLLVVVLALGLGRDPSRLPSPFIGKQLPEFTAPMLGDNEGKPVSSTDLNGEVWMLNIWASWCVPCLQEHPQITWLSSQGVKVVGLNFKDDATEAKDWLEKNGNPFLFSLVDADGAIGIDLGAYGVPESFVIDAEGKLLHKHVGPVFANEARNILEIAKNAAEGVGS